MIDFMSYDWKNIVLVVRREAVPDLRRFQEYKFEVGICHGNTPLWAWAKFAS
jgi:hypothetical protein